MINDTRFAFFILTCLHKIHSFSLALSSEAIAIDKRRLIAPHLYHILLTLVYFP